MEDYKKDIIDTRLGCLGSSDAKLLAQVAANGSVPKSAYRRLAVVKGLVSNEEIPRTAAVEAGDIIEQAIFSNLSTLDDRYISNPRWESRKFSRPNVKLISHPDIVLQDENTKTLFVYEVKTTKSNIEETKEAYKEQLFIHHTIAREICSSLGKGWKVRLFLAHYDTEGLNLENDFIEFDPARLTLCECRPHMLFDIAIAMDITDRFLSEMKEYYDDELDANYLPADIRKEFDNITSVLQEIKEREKTVDSFKERLYRFLLEKNIKSISGDSFIVTRVDETESHIFDTKKYLDDFATQHPMKYRKIAAQYDKSILRKGYAKITLRKPTA